MGIGDVTRPLPRVIVDAMQQAAEELAHEESFRGYCPENGYEWLRQTIIDHDFAPRGIHFHPDEVFISEGAGSDLGNLSELFDRDNKVAIMDPTYPAYVDANIMAGREISFLPCLKENQFVPELPAQPVDIIYLCFPNNPTGAVLTRDQLRLWVNYAHRHHSLIIFDAAYEAYISSPDIPHSIYEIEGAREVAIEVHSFSKSAGFTSVRCGYVVVPFETGLQAMWMRRQCTKYNGTAYVSQRAAQATFTPEGQKGIHANIGYYKATASLILQGLRDAGLEVYGGENAPYIWCRAPHRWDSWTFFEYLLNRCQVVSTPGVGFGRCGEGFVRFSAFANRPAAIEALQRIQENI
jgi:LL-diaminopimelate aminotransferase